MLLLALIGISTNVKAADKSIVGRERRVLINFHITINACHLDQNQTNKVV